jgi:hypothetical protein
MSFRKFERVKRRNPKLSRLLDSLFAYIETQVEGGQSYILPKLAAAALRLKDGEAFVLLELLAEGDVLEHVYNVYCRKENTFLATISNPDSLDEIPHCDYCDEDHEPGDLKIEIAFRLKNGNSAFMAA